MAEPEGGHDRQEDGISPLVDLASGGVLAAAALGALLWLFPATINTDADNYDISPALVPNLMAGAILILGVALTLSAFVRLDRRTKIDPVIWAGPLFWAVACTLLYLGFAHAGFLVVGPLVIALGLHFCGQRSWLLTAALAIGLPLLIDAAAWRIFTVDLP